MPDFASWSDFDKGLLAFGIGIVWLSWMLERIGKVLDSIKQILLEIRYRD